MNWSHYDAFIVKEKCFNEQHKTLLSKTLLSRELAERDGLIQSDC